MDQFMFNPSGASFSNKLPMKSVSKLVQMNSLEDIYRYKVEASVGTYYPVRFLTGAFIDTDAEWPVVIPLGTIVSVASIKDARAYSAACAETGIGVSGEIPVSIDIDGNVLEKSIDFVYPRDIAGFITICNGGADVTDTYSDNDGTYGILTMSGEVADSSATFTRPANKPAGIVASKVYADLRYRYLNYEIKPQGVSIERAGVLTLPYIAIYGSGVTATVLAAVRAAVNSRHQYVWVDGANQATAMAKLDNEALLQSDPYGKFTASDGTAAQVFGKVLENRNRVPSGLDEIIQSVPGSAMQGTDTGGLPARLYDFMKSILSASGIKPSGYSVTNANIKSLLYGSLATATANVTIEMGQVDVAFGYIAK